MRSGGFVLLKLTANARARRQAEAVSRESLPLGSVCIAVCKNDLLSIRYVVEFTVRWCVGLCAYMHVQNNIHLTQNVLLFCIPIQYPLGKTNLPISIPTKSAQTCPNHWFCPGIKFAVSVSSTKTVAFADVVTASDTIATVLLISDDEKEVLTVTGIGNFIFLSFPLPHKFGPKFLIDSGKCSEDGRM